VSPPSASTRTENVSYPPLTAPAPGGRPIRHLAAGDESGFLRARAARRQHFAFAEKFEHRPATVLPVASPSPRHSASPRLQRLCPRFPPSVLSALAPGPANQTWKTTVQAETFRSEFEICFERGECLGGFTWLIKNQWHFSSPAVELLIPTLIAAIGDSDPARARAIETLGILHIEPETVVPALTNCFPSLPPTLRYNAVLALSRFESEAGQMLPLFFSLLNHDEEIIRAIGDCPHRSAAPHNAPVH
jgi:hypothetical protein